MGTLQYRSLLFRCLALAAFWASFSSPLWPQSVPTLPPPIGLQGLGPILFEEIKDPSSFSDSLFFGAAMSIFGNTALVGIPGFENVGRVAIFRRDSSGLWQRQGSIESPDGVPNAFFGEGLTLHRHYALVRSRSGTHIYRRTKGGFEFQRTTSLFASVDRATGLLYSSSPAADGSLIVRVLWLSPRGRLFEVQRFIVPADIVTPGSIIESAVWNDRFVITNASENNSQGAAYVFERSHRSWRWRLTQKLIAADGNADDQFGFSVRVHGDTIVVGARGADPVPSRPGCSNFQDGSGAVYVFKRRHGLWSEDQKLKSSAEDPGCVPQFGERIFFSGKVLLVLDVRPDSVSAGNGWHVFERQFGQFQPVAFQLVILDRATFTYEMQGSTLFHGIPLEHQREWGSVGVYDLTP
jgi:hypothetical protein